MPTNTSLIINATDINNKKTSNTINYVNPSISNNTALELAQRINALTNDTYQSTTRVDKEEIDSSIKRQRNITAITYLSGALPFTIDGNKATINLKPSSVNGYGSNTLRYWTYLHSADFNNQQWVIPKITDTSFQGSLTISAEAPSNGNARIGASLNTSETPTPGDVITYKLTLPEDEQFLEQTYDVTFNIIEEE